MILSVVIILFVDSRRTINRYYSLYHNTVIDVDSIKLYSRTVTLLDHINYKEP